MAVRILLVDDNAIVRAGYRRLLERTPGLIVVGEAEDGDEVLALVERLGPDLVVMDVEMRRVGGLRAARSLFEACVYFRRQGGQASQENPGFCEKFIFCSQTRLGAMALPR